MAGLHTVEPRYNKQYNKYNCVKFAVAKIWYTNLSYKLNWDWLDSVGNYHENGKHLVCEKVSNATGWCDRDFSHPFVVCLSNHMQENGCRWCDTMSHQAVALNVVPQYFWLVNTFDDNELSFQLTDCKQASHCKWVYHDCFCIHAKAEGLVLRSEWPCTLHLALY